MAEAVNPEAQPADARHGSLEVYNPLQQRELEANVFAVQLLVPRDLLYRLFVRQRLPARAIAARLGVSSALVLNALTSLLLPGAQAGRK